MGVLFPLGNSAGALPSRLRVRIHALSGGDTVLVSAGLANSKNNLSARRLMSMDGGGPPRQ